MNSKEIIKKVIEFDMPPRIGLTFNKGICDIMCVLVTRLINTSYMHLGGWGYHKNELEGIPSFKGEVRRDAFGNIFGRLGGKTKGECIKGILQDGWENLDNFELPQSDYEYEKELIKIIKQNNDKFLLGAFPMGIFSTLRDLRGMDNILMDLLLEKDMVLKLIAKLEILSLSVIERALSAGFDGVFIGDDWGTQQALLISPSLWRDVFKPTYAKIAREAHKNGMKFFIHSCGYIYDIIEDFIEIGVDVLQLDQPELIGVEKLAAEFGGRVTFWSPVDIQKIMQTGDRYLIEDEARKMMEHFNRFKGGFIAKDYPAWEDIDVKDEWAQWARDIFIAN